MRWIVILGLILLVAVATACAKTEVLPAENMSTPEEGTTPEGTTSEESTPEAIVVEVVEQEEKIIEDEPTPSISEDAWAIPDNPLTAVVCDKAAKQLRFVVTNTDNKIWEVDAIQPFPPPKDRISVSIFVNGLNVHKEKTYFSKETFSDCWNKELILPGESFSCALSPIPLTAQNAYSRNYVQIRGNTINNQITYECE